MKKIIAALAALLAASAICRAQDFQTGYFLKDYVFAYKLNPAFRPDKSFVGLPALGNISVRTGGNVGIDNFLFPLSNGKLGTFLHPEVSASEFLGPLGKRNKISAGASVNLLAVGVKSKFLYHTFDVGLRSVNSLSVPYEMFSFMKEGLDGTVNIPDIKFGSSTFVEVGYGVNFKIGNIFSAGVRVKGLVGLMNARMDVSNLSVTSAGGNWTITAEGTFRGAVKGVTVPTKLNDEGQEIIDLSNLAGDIDGIDSPAGMGGAVDLGICFSPLPKLEISASLTDLGGIRWSNNVNGKTASSSWTYDGDNDDVLDELASIMEFRKQDEDKKFLMLPATARIGAKYGLLPFLDAGLLLTHGFGGVPWNEARLSANLALLKTLNLTGAAAYGDFGFSWGVALDLNLRVINIFIGADSIPTRFTPQYIPLGKPNLALAFGLNITI